MKYFKLIFLCFFLQNVCAQQTEYVDFISAKIDVSFVPDSVKVFGIANYKFEILKPIDSIYLDAKKIKFDNVSLDNEYVDYVNDQERIYIKAQFKVGQFYEVSFNFNSYPNKALYFVEKGDDIQIWTQGQGKYTSNWLPSIDDMNEKIEFDLNILFNEKYTVISNGKLEGKGKIPGKKNWIYNMNNPMPSYLVALAIGKYDKQTFYSRRGVPIELYYYPEDSLKVEPTYRYTKPIFDFFEEEIGVPYPWQNYKQIPVHDFLYAGMENTGATIFSDQYMIDERGFTDGNYVNVNAHELAHQWFGNLVTATHGTHHWLQEGFATYYALLAEKEVFGEQYFNNKLLEYAQNLKFQDDVKQGSALLDPKASSVTFYQRGAWALHTLRGLVGDEVFKLAVKNYLERYQFNNADTNDFLVEVQQLTDEDIDEFAKIWLVAETFPYDHAIDILKMESNFVKQYEKVDCEVYSQKCDYWLEADLWPETKAKLISQVPDKITKSTFTFGPKVRQAIARYVTKIPLDLKEEYESLLNDDSYITVQYALLNLWKNFPEDRIKYLDATKDIIGLPNKNVRLVWLALRSVTENYDKPTELEHYKELLGYSSSKYNAQIREEAFNWLFAIQACNSECQANLEQARKHHNWRLKKYAKEMIEGG